MNHRLSTEKFAVQNAPAHLPVLEPAKVRSARSGSRTNVDSDSGMLRAAPGRE